MDEIIFDEKDALQTEIDPITQLAQDAYGISYLYPWQRLVIANILDATQRSEADKDKEELGQQVVLLPTGAGKSLCFMVPALALKGCTLIFYPLLALMADQERRMTEGGMPPVVFRGGQTPEERAKNFERIKKGAKFILANPEVLQSKSLLQKLSECNIEHIAIDEAHCVSEWGDTFRPAYLELGNIIKTLGVNTVTAFTATASPTVLERISDILFDGKGHLVRSDSDRPNIHYSVKYGYIKERLLLDCLMQSERPLIVFCGTRHRAEETARLLRFFLAALGEDSHDTVRFYHAGLSREEKTITEKWFYPKTDGILTATCAFGMGVDKKDIRTVIHLDPPTTAEAYIQEAGRGGRDGSIAQAVLLWSPEDSEKAKTFEKGSRQRVLEDFAELRSCRRQVLLDALGGEQVACTGCDICNGTANFEYSDKATTIQFLKRHKSQYTQREFEAELRKKMNAINFEHYGLHTWDVTDIHRLVEQLIKQNHIRIHQDIFRKGLVY